MNPIYDVAIVGAGPTGTICALSLLEAGIKPVIIEKESFPRYHIGESLTGKAGQLLRELGLGSYLEARNFPVKHGVTVYGAKGDNNFWVPVCRLDENEQLHPSTTWQVRRADFDQMLLDVVQERGAEVIQGEALHPIMDGKRVKGVSLRSDQGQHLAVHAPVVVDASGQSTFLASKSDLTSPKINGKYARQIAIFSQVSDAIRPAEDADNTLIFYREKNHWAWFIPIAPGLVSVGIVTSASYFQGQGLSSEAFLKQELRSLNPELTRRMPNDLSFVEPVRTASNYSYRVKQFIGDGFLCVGDAHRFVDPIFSFGVHFGIHEGHFAAKSIETYLSGHCPQQTDPFTQYQALAESGQNVIQDLIDCFWEYPLPFLIISQYQYREDVTKLFGGHIYAEDVDQWGGVRAMRELLYSSLGPASAG